MGPRAIMLTVRMGGGGWILKILLDVCFLQTVFCQMCKKLCVYLKAENIRSPDISPCTGLNILPATSCFTMTIALNAKRFLECFIPVVWGPRSQTI